MLEESINPRLPMIHAGMFRDSGKIVMSLAELSNVDHKKQAVFEQSVFFYAELNEMVIERQTIPSTDSFVLSWYPVNKKEND